ncbi:MAG: right-handed parallel beta-helix repeat-containing protein [Victivallales bacterium]|nr:right-handed parallel beta-helix repeat-containing protein [Victivallales bacterium]
MIIQRLPFIVALLFTTIIHAASDVVTASSFGFDKNNATQCLQAALDSGAKKVIIDNVGSPWIVTPLQVRSNTEVVLQDGVVIEALKDAFKGRSESLVNFVKVKDVVFRGEGKATLRMHKKDYQDTTRYEWAEWRHTVNISGAENITVKDLTLESSGGDGVYVRGNGIPASKNILLENLICRDHHRQGISVISAEDLLVRNCQFLATRGTPPQAGIDIEPNRPKDRIINNVFEHCIFNDNASHGIDLYLSPLDATTVPLSITFKNCISHNNNSAGISITSSHSTPVKGTVKFIDCDIAGNKGNALAISEQQPNGLDISFENCNFDATAAEKTSFTFTQLRVKEDMQGVHFKNCKLTPGKSSPMDFFGSVGCGIVELDGDVTLPDGSQLDFAKLIANNPPRPELRVFKTEICNMKLLKPFPNDVKPQKPSNPTMRRSFTFVAYFPAPGKYPIVFSPVQVGNKTFQADVDLLDPAGNLMDSFSFKGEEPFTFAYDAKHAGIVSFFVKPKNQGVKVSAEVPWGLLANTPVSLFRGHAHDFYFVVPAGLQEFHIEVSGEPAETLDAALVNPQGIVAAEAKTIRASVILTAKRPENAPAEVWKLQMTEVIEDHKFCLGAGVVPIASTDPKLVLQLVK